MLFSPSRSTRQARASLLLPGVLICVILAAVGASMPAKCPDHIECARRGRHFCKPGSANCGPCLIPLEEDQTGHCVARSVRYTAQSHDPVAPLSGIDEEIDFLSSVITKQQLSKSKQSDSAPQSPPQLQSKQKSLYKTTTVEPMTTSPTTPTHTTNSSNRHGPDISPNSSRDSLLVLMISLCIIVGAMALILVTVCWVRLQRETRLAQKVDYPAFQEAANRNHTSSGDKTLAHSAQMYHYQHQKQQMLSMEKHKAEPKVSESGGHSDEETEEGDFTVYECPGLAPTGEMEVKNPLFDDSTLHSQKNHK